MSSASRTANTLSGAVLGILATGGLFLVLGFVFWFAFLAADSVLLFDQVSRHMYQPTYRPFSFFGSGGSVGLGYTVAFFLAAFLVARPRWRYRPGLSSAVAYAAFLAFYLPSLDWSRGFSSDCISLIVPLIISPIGGLLGERFFAKTQNA